MAKLITYDLKTPGQNYTGLIDAIKGIGAWARPLESTWVVQTEQSPDAIRDYLIRFIDINDLILVVDIAGASWASRVSQEINNWLGAYV